jgi:adenylate kinase
MSKGEIVPINIVVETIVNAIKTSPTDVVVIDGYPRSVEQMNELDSYLHKEDFVTLVNVIEIEVSEETARDRVLGRARGADDNTEVFNNRMKVYTEPLNAIQSFYSEKNLHTKISGEASIEDIVSVLDTFIQSKI